MGFSLMLWGAEKLVPAEYWCSYGINKSNIHKSSSARKKEEWKQEGAS